MCTRKEGRSDLVIYIYMEREIRGRDRDREIERNVDVKRLVLYIILRYLLKY